MNRRQLIGGSDCLCLCVCVEIVTTRPPDFVFIIFFISGSRSVEASVICEKDVDHDYIDVPPTSIFNNRLDMLMKDSSFKYRVRTGPHGQ